MRTCLLLVLFALGMTLTLSGCHHDPPPLDLDAARKPDMAEQIMKGEKPSGVDMARKAAQGK